MYWRAYSVARRWASNGSRSVTLKVRMSAVEDGETDDSASKAAGVRSRSCRAATVRTAITGRRATLACVCGSRLGSMLNVGSETPFRLAGRFWRLSRTCEEARYFAPCCNETATAAAGISTIACRAIHLRLRSTRRYPLREELSAVMFRSIYNAAFERAQRSVRVTVPMGYFRRETRKFMSI